MQGPSFFETRMGRRFFEAMVPRLVSSLERIAESLERQAPSCPPFAAGSTVVVSTPEPDGEFLVLRHTSEGLYLAGPDGRQIIISTKAAE